MEVVNQGECLPQVAVVVIWWVVGEVVRDWIVPEARILPPVLVQPPKVQLKKVIRTMSHT